MRAPEGLFLRRIRSSGFLLTGLVLAAFLAALLAAALADLEVQAMPQAVHRHLARSRPSMLIIGLGDARAARGATAAIRRSMGAAMAGVPYRLDGAIWSGPLVLATPGGRTVPQGEVATPAAFAAHATLVAGAWPGRPSLGGPIPVALPTPAARRLRAALGTVIATRDRNTGARLRLRVTGTYRQRDPASPYWDIDRIWTCGASTQHCFTASGPIIANPAAFGRGGLAIAQSSWVVLPASARIGAGALTDLADRISRAAARLQRPDLGGLVVTTDLPELLQRTVRELAVARSLLAISGLELLLPTVAVLALAARLLASHREEEAALLSARGAARWQLARPALAEAAVTGAAAAAAGAVAGHGLASSLAATAHLGQEELRLSAIPLAAWLAALGVAVLCVAVTLLPALRPSAPGTALARRGRQAAQAAAVAAGADVLVLALAVTAGWELDSYSAVARLASGGSSVDPVLAAAPALALAGISLVPLRALPLLARFGDRMAVAGRHLGGALATWEISRRPVRQATLVVLAVLTVATSTVALAQYQSWRRSAQDQAAFAAGADVRVDTQSPLPPDRVTAMTRAPGVTAAMPVSRVDMGDSGDVLALDARAARATVLLRPDLSPVPAALLWRQITLPGPQPGVVLPGRPARLEIRAAVNPGRVARREGLASATVSVQDTYGSVYSLPAGTAAADGHTHPLIATLSASRQAGYPLRLVGLSVTYAPPVAGSGRAGAAAGPPARLRIGSIAVASSVNGGFGRPFASGRALQRWVTAPSSAGRLGTVTLAAPAPARVIPAIATRAFLKGQHVGVGAILPVPVGPASVVVKVVAEVNRFATVTGSGGALIVDQAAVQDVLAARGDPPLPVTSWWLRAGAGVALPALPAGSAVTTRAGQAAALLADPLTSVAQQAALAVAAAMTLLAAVGFSVSVAASVRARRGQDALLAALGVGNPARVRALCMEQFILSLPAAAAGLLGGAALAHLLVPVVTLTPAAAAPVPPVLVDLPLGQAVLLALGVTAIPVLAAAVTVARRPGTAAQLRAAEAS